MARRSQLPTPTQSRIARAASSVARTAVEPPAPSPCPGASRLPRASGLRPPQTYGLGERPSPPCVRAPATPQASALRPPQVRSGLRPPQVSRLRPPSGVCVRSPASSTPSGRQICPPSVRTERSRSPPPQRARSPCPAAASTEEPLDPRALLMSEQSDEEAAARAALRAQWAASLAAYPDTPAEQLRRVEERRQAAARMRQQAELAKAQTAAALRRRQIEAQRELQLREAEDQRETFNMTLEAIEEMLMEERDMMLREQQARLLLRARQQITDEAQWHAALGIADEWRRNMLEAYQPYAAAEARLAAERQILERRRMRYRSRLRAGPQMDPLEEAQVDVFDESPPSTLPPPMLSDLVYERPPTSFDAGPLNLMDDSPPLGLDNALLDMYPSSDLSSFETPQARRQLLFDSDDDSDLLEGAIGGDFI